MGDESYDDYVEYYRARARRVAASRLYPNAIAAELAMLRAIEQAGSVEAFEASIGDLRLRCSRELVRDQASARAQLYADTAESVRAQEPSEVLAGLDAVTDVAGLKAVIDGAAQRAMTATTADSFIARFTDCLTVLEDIEVWQQAHVPDRWRAELDGWAAEATREAHAGWQEVEGEARTWDPSWRFDEDVAREARHRRLLPIPQAVLDRRLAQHRTSVRGEE